MSKEEQKSKEKENIKIIVDPKTDQFVVYRSIFSLASIVLLSLFMLSCLGNKGVEEEFSKKPKTAVEKATSNSSAEKEVTKSNEEDLSNLLVKTEDEKEKKAAPEEKAELKENSSQTAKRAKADDNMLVVSKKNRSLVEKIRKQLYYGNYRRVLALSKKSKEPIVVYYRGIAYYSMMLSRARYSRNDRRNFHDKALALFRDAEKRTKQSELKSRALLWHAITRDITTKSTKQKTMVIQNLKDIRKNFPNSSVANDALLYEGDVLTTMNRKNEAREVYKQLLSQSFSDEVVYDRYENKVVSQKKAVEYALKRVAKR